MYYIQHGRLASQHSCPRSKGLFHAIRSWLLAVVLSGSLRPPPNRQYITYALTELGVTSSSGAHCPSIIPIDNQPEPGSKRKESGHSAATVAVIEKDETVKKTKAPSKTKAKTGPAKIPSVKETAARPSPSKGSFAYPIVSVIEEEEDPHL